MQKQYHSDRPITTSCAPVPPMSPSPHVPPAPTPTSATFIFSGENLN